MNVSPKLFALLLAALCFAPSGVPAQDAANPAGTAPATDSKRRLTPDQIRPAIIAMLERLAIAAALTPMVWDDLALRGALWCVKNDAIWAILLGLIQQKAAAADVPCAGAEDEALANLFMAFEMAA